MINRPRLNTIVTKVIGLVLSNKRNRVNWKMSSNTHPQKNNLLTKLMKTNFTKNLKGSTRIMDLIFMLAIAIAYDFVKHIDRKHQTIREAFVSKKCSFFWTLFKRPLTPPLLFEHLSYFAQGVFWTCFWAFDIMYLFYPQISPSMPQM